MDFRKRLVEKLSEEDNIIELILNRTDEDIENVDINEWVKRTEGMSLSHLKEVVISTIVMGREFEEVMDNLEGLKKAPSIKGSGKVGFGR
jgi:hypothetical protein